MKFKNLTGKILIEKLQELSEDELNKPIVLFDNSNNVLKSINDIVSLENKIMLLYSLASNQK